MKGSIIIIFILAEVFNYSFQNKIQGETSKQLNSFLIKTDHTKETIEQLLHKAEMSPSDKNSLVEVNNMGSTIQTQPTTITCKSSPQTQHVNSSSIRLESTDRKKPIRRRDLIRVRNNNDDADEDDDERPYDEFMQLPAKQGVVNLKQTGKEKGFEIDEDAFGYGYALIVFFVVLGIAIIGYKALYNQKWKKAQSEVGNASADYILFDVKDEETEVATML